MRPGILLFPLADYPSLGCWYLIFRSKVTPVASPVQEIDIEIPLSEESENAPAAKHLDHKQDVKTAGPWSYLDDLKQMASEKKVKKS